jgi:hypothetical protein
MTPFQAIKATFSMWLAKAREPIEHRELAPVSTGARLSPSGSTRPGKGHVPPVDCSRIRTMFRAGSRVPMQSGSVRAMRGPSARRV